jgi:uncharacterized protein with von Willebrand factor type A (vWA) domain
MGGQPTKTDAKQEFEQVLTLRKEKVLTLRKELGLGDVKAQVVLALDYSGSMGSMYSNGDVQKLVERLLPIGMAFDDNQEVDFYLFHDSVKKVPEALTTSNIQGYIDGKVLGKYQMGGTDYAPVIKQIVKDFTSKKGFLSSGFKKMDMPVYVIFITDGDTDNKKGVEEAVKEASHAGIFFQFVGIGKTNFPFLEKLDDLQGRLIDNANFFSIANLDGKTDDELYKLLLTEFPAWIPQAKAKELIK